MADKTKAELEAENQELREKLDRNAPLRDTSWYDEQMNSKDKEIEVLKSDINGMKERDKRHKREREIKQDDAERKEKLTAAMIRRKNSGRFPITDHPTRTPHRTLAGDSNGPVFDLGVELEGYDGAVFIPVGWVKEMGRSMGMLSEDQADLLKDELNTEKSRNEIAVALAEELKDGITHCIDRFNDALANHVPELNVDSESGEEESEGDNSTSGTSNSESGEIEGQTSIADYSEESSGVSGDSGNADSESGKSDESKSKNSKSDGNDSGTDEFEEFGI